MGKQKKKKKKIDEFTDFDERYQTETLESTETKWKVYILNCSALIRDWKSWNDKQNICLFHGFKKLPSLLHQLMLCVLFCCVLFD